MSDEQRSVLDWFDEGREARLCQRSREENPYPVGETSHDAWDRGWSEANDPNEKTKGYS